MSTSISTVSPTEITTAVSTQVRGYLQQGTLQLPPNYSADNALKSAMLSLPAVVDANKVPVLKSCTPESIKSALLSMCIQGLNPDKKQCYFIAYGSKLTLSRSYFGDIAIAKQVDPNIEDVYPVAVFEGDSFAYQIKRGQIVNIDHTQKLENKNKPIVAAYATVVYRNGKEISTVMTMEQIKQSWKQSQTRPVDANGIVNPASTHGKYPEEMAKKTVVHRACKPIIDSSDDSNLMVQYAKQSADDADAIEVGEEIEENANQTYIDVEPREDVEEPDQTVKTEDDPF